MLCRGELSYVTQLSFSQDGQTLAAGGRVRAIERWDVASGKALGSLSRSDVVKYSPDGSHLATVDPTFSISLLSTAGQSTSRVLSGHSDRVDHIQFSADGRTLVSSSHDRSIILWDVPSAREKARVLRMYGGGAVWITPEGYYDYEGEKVERDIHVRTGPGLLGMAPLVWTDFSLR